jgi:hypothetical protein
MRKATHNGTCQVCGSTQALPGGALSNHGYTVEHHFFEGVCPGAKRRPLEQDRALADHVARDLWNQATELDDLAADIVAGRAFPSHVNAGFTCRDRTNRWTEVRIPYADGDQHQQRGAVQAFLWNTEARSKQAKSIAKEILARADKITGKKALSPRVEEVKKVIEAGTIVKLHGNPVTVLRVESRQAHGCGPYLNGQHLPHIVFERNGKLLAYPVRLIRRASILN